MFFLFFARFECSLLISKWRTFNFNIISVMPQGNRLYSIMIDDTFQKKYQSLCDSNMFLIHDGEHRVSIWLSHVIVVTLCFSVKCRNLQTSSFEDLTRKLDCRCLNCVNPYEMVVDRACYHNLTFILSFTVCSEQNKSYQKI